MKKTFRTWLKALEDAGELRRVSDEVEPRYISALTANSVPGLLLEHVVGYDIAHVGGLVKSRRQLTVGLGIRNQDIAPYVQHGVEEPIPPKVVGDSPAHEIVQTGDDVDLCSLPIPVLHTKDGGPYFTSGVVVALTPDGKRNAGMYRMMYRSPRETSIDLASHSDLRRLARAAYSAGKPLPIAVALGVHLNEMLAAGYGLPYGLDEMAMAGGLHGEPVELVKGLTVDLEVPAESEIILEGEILPVGWTQDEGRFGDAYWVMGEVEHNPVVRITAIARRRDAMLYSMHMPWENSWLGRATNEARAWKTLRDCRIDVRAVKAGFSSMVASIRKAPGEGKNALLALLSQGILKMAIVTDDDVDIFNQEELEWALAYRVQADKDIIIVQDTRGKHLDPSTRSWELPPGQLPTSARIGIDATIPERVPAEKYEHQQYPYQDKISQGSVPNHTANVGQKNIVARIRERLGQEPAFFSDIVDVLEGAPYQEILRAWGTVRQTTNLERDKQGRYRFAS